MTAKVENIIAQFRDLCTGNFDFFSPQGKCDHAPGGATLGAPEKMAGTSFFPKGGVRVLRTHCQAFL